MHKIYLEKRCMIICSPQEQALSDPNSIELHLGCMREFRCSDNTDPIFIDSELVEILQKIRNHFGKPVNITSSFRTASKNAMIKNAAKFSQHLYGKAADIWISGVTVEQIAAYAETLLPNRGGIGRYPKEGHADRTHGWVHIDTRTAKSRWVS